MKRKNDCHQVVPTADLLSAIESLVIYGGKSSRNTNGCNTYCKGAVCGKKKKRTRPILNSAAKCNTYCGAAKGCPESY